MVAASARRRTAPVVAHDDHEVFGADGECDGDLGPGGMLGSIREGFPDHLICDGPNLVGHGSQIAVHRQLRHGELPALGDVLDKLPDALGLCLGSAPCCVLQVTNHVSELGKGPPDLALRVLDGLGRASRVAFQDAAKTLQL